jgi:glutathione synthase/RimK-type ligase-like ATP-grasp enzyme
MDNLEGYVSDDELAIEPLKNLGWNVETISWQDKTVDWNEFAAVIIRTPWNYQKFPAEFIEVLRKIDASTARLENSLKIVEWNLSKTYLRELESKQIKIVPTIWDEKSVMHKDFHRWKTFFNTNKIIIKPIVSATAEHTYRLTEFLPELTEIFANKPFMVQPFMPKIVEEGEFSLFYFGGKYSHTILKSPKAKDFRVQEEHGGIITQVQPSKQLSATAQKVFNQINENLLYARVDFVRDDNDNFCLMELELIEPALYLRMDKNAPQFFAETIDKRLKNYEK